MATDCTPISKNNVLKRPDLKSDESNLLDRYKWLHPDCASPPMPVDKMTKGNPIRDKKMYHVLVDRLKILDRGDGQPWAPAIPTIPERRYFSPGSPAKKRGRDSAADAAFDNFGSRVASSLSKKPKPK
ncbi:hypothetical protein DFH09DRAFT_1095718 [Mycena vulgaris]|nr:hypothetical protein DFH09DRAFT_1095718 [Mycena vulgaris]